MFKNLQGSSSQPLELHSFENEQPLQLEGRDNQELELEEETKHTSEEEREEEELPLTPQHNSTTRPTTGG